MVSLEIGQKLLNGLYKDADATQMAHVGKDVNGVEALQAVVDIKDLCQMICHAFQIRVGRGCVRS